MHAPTLHVAPQAPILHVETQAHILRVESPETLDLALRQAIASPGNGPPVFLLLLGRELLAR